MWPSGKLPHGSHSKTTSVVWLQLTTSWCRSTHLAHRLTSAEGRDGARGCAGRAARAWCGRFCKRFAFTRKRLGAGAQLPADELEDKVRGFWHWVDYLQRVAAMSGREPVFLNFDETPISQWWPQIKGCVATKCRWRQGVAPEAVVPASRRRGSVTFGAIATNHADLQPLLPQLLLGNQRVLSRAFCAEVQAAAAASPVLRIWAEK
ncbi:unnamed protein product, partial [Effrenium voratum]